MQEIIGKLNTIPHSAYTQGTANVKTFGALGDGVTNDTEAIKKAIATGKAVYFPSGTYLIYEQIDVSRDLCIFGDGDASVVKMMPGDNLTCKMVNSGAGHNIELRNLVLDANKAGYLANGATDDCSVSCVYLWKPNSVKMSNVVCKNAYSSGAIIMCEDDDHTEVVQIDNCCFQGNGIYQEGGDGLELLGDLSNVVVANCVMANNGAMGLSVTGRNGKFSNISSYGNGWDGVCLGGMASYNLLSNIDAHGNRGGVHLKSSSGADIDGSAVKACTNYGNMFQNVRTAGNTYGIMFGVSCDTKICGLCSDDEYGFALCCGKNAGASGNVINESFVTKGTDLSGDSFESICVDFIPSLTLRYPL